MASGHNSLSETNPIRSDDAATVEVKDALPRTPSSLYSARGWQLGLALARFFPGRLSAGLASGMARAYALARPMRQEAVIQNLLPAVGNDLDAARKISRELFQQFSRKLIDLWRYESGQSINHLFDEFSGWEHFKAAQEEGRGVLLLTPHLGNWEFGALLLKERGVQLLVITLAEPQNRLTELRKTGRARWGVETLVIGKDPFGFVDIIRRLEQGATVALLVDRPPAYSSVIVELFGRPFPASIAAAELARASNCILLPVYLPRTARGYAAHTLPAIDYDRAALRDPEARRQLTQTIVRAFEGPIRDHLNQWFHFVPIWPASTNPGGILRRT
jgi:lauroyl/myristoyl acyltransferase